MNYFATFSATLILIAFYEDSVLGLSCSECIRPQFQNQPLYLPFCYNEKTYNNLCEALCSISEVDISLDSGKPVKGSCNKCELKCSKIFIPTCSTVIGSESPTVFPNKCHAKCSGMEYEDCKSFPFPPVIPGKSRLPSLPLSKVSPEGLQNLDSF